MQMIFLLIPLLLFTMYALLLLYYRRGWLAIENYDTLKTAADLHTKITVIIPARNEDENIKVCLDSIVNQTYPKKLFEVIVVDDHSTDNTAEVVKQFSNENVRIISLKDFTTGGPINSYKKKAIETAIEFANGDLIISTDADCIAGKDWIRAIASFYEDTDAAFIAAPVSFKEEPEALKIFQSLDFMTLQGITGASVYKKIHSMCNGANLAYEKKVFYEVDGFKNIDSIASGDDMLLMHKIFELYPERVKFLRSKKAIIETAAMDSLKDFFNQRIRWASKADKYDDKRIFAVLMMVYLFNLLLLLIPILGAFKNIQYSIFNIQCSIFGYWLCLLIGKTIVELFFLFPIAKFFDKQKQLWWFPVAQPFHIVYTVIAGWLGKFGNYQWKGRTVK
jgi:cellulose synthase/poly-beta-1,6-N-acetylglucosamine synthase-like glycosyltransferase